MKMLFYAVTICLVAGPAFAGEKLSFPGEGLKSVLADIDMGALNISGVASKDALVEILDNDPAKCSVSAKAEGGVLRLAIKALPRKDAKGWRNLFGLINRGRETEDCKASFAVAAPASLPLDLKADMGRLAVENFSSDVKIDADMGAVTVAGLTGAVAINSDMGKVEGSACAKKLTLKSDMGAVNLNGLCGPAEVKSDMGSVTLEWARVPETGEAVIKSGMGAVRLAFPEGSKLDVSFESDMSKMTNEFQNRGGFRVHGKVGMGSVSIVKAGK